MLFLVDLDISKADLALFEEYETKVLSLLESYGAKLLERLRSTDETREFHLLHFPDLRALMLSALILRANDFRSCG